MFRSERLIKLGNRWFSTKSILVESCLFKKKNIFNFEVELSYVPKQVICVIRCVETPNAKLKDKNQTFGAKV